jgi:hypothetical protein
MRHLLWHPESVCLWEVHDEEEYESCMSSLEVEDVTGIPEFEQRFKEHTVSDVKEKTPRPQPGVAPPPPVDRLISVFVKIRQARAELAKTYEEQDADLKAKLKTIEVELLRRAQEQGVDGFKTAKGTTYIQEEWHVSIENDEAFYGFLRETGDLEYLSRRVTLEPVKKYHKDHDGSLPPGLRVFRENRMHVRKSKKKGVVEDEVSDD